MSPLKNKQTNNKQYSKLCNSENELLNSTPGGWKDWWRALGRLVMTNVYEYVSVRVNSQNNPFRCPCLWSSSSFTFDNTESKVWLNFCSTAQNRGVIETRPEFGYFASRAHLLSWVVRLSHPWKATGHLYFYTGNTDSVKKFYICHSFPGTYTCISFLPPPIQTEVKIKWIFKAYTGHSG